MRKPSKYVHDSCAYAQLWQTAPPTRQLNGKWKKKKNAENSFVFRLRVNVKVRLREIKMSVFYLALDAKTCRSNSFWFPAPPLRPHSHPVNPHHCVIPFLLARDALTQSHFLCLTVAAVAVVALVLLPALRAVRAHYVCRIHRDR